MNRPRSGRFRRGISALIGVVVAITVSIDAGREMKAERPRTERAAAVVAPGDLHFSVARLAGQTAAATAATVSRRFFAPGTPAAFVVTNAHFEDALAVGPAAAKVGGPLLFTNPNDLSSATRAELQRLQPDRIFVIGDTDAVASGVLAELDTLASGGATRISAENQYRTAAKIATRFFPTASWVFVATGEGYHNALAGAPAAAVKDAPMLLTLPNSLPPVTRDELARLDPDRILLLGSTGSVSADVAAALAQFGTVERIAGAGANKTAVAISKRIFGTNRQTTFLTTNQNFLDAAASTSPAGRSSGPILWVTQSNVEAGTQTELTRLSPRTVYIVGGTSAVGAPVAKTVQRLLGVCWAGRRPSVAGEQLITRVPSATKQIALTFDMGGRLVPAEDIIAFLASNQVCTTFFPTGVMAQFTDGLPVMEAIARRPELFEMGNHTQHHCNLVTGGGGSPTSEPCQVPMTSTFIRNELTEAGNIIQILSGMPVRPYWRPPYSAFNQFVLDNAAAVDYTKTIQFNIDTIDWRETTTTSDIVNRVTNPLPPDGSIVLMHLGGFHTFDALPWIVTYLRDRGYTFTSVSDMLD